MSPSIGRGFEVTMRKLQMEGTLGSLGALIIFVRVLSGLIVT